MISEVVDMVPGDHGAVLVAVKHGMEAVLADPGPQPREVGEGLEGLRLLVLRHGEQVMMKHRDSDLPNGLVVAQLVGQELELALRDARGVVPVYRAAIRRELPLRTSWRC